MINDIVFYSSGVSLRVDRQALEQLVQRPPPGANASGPNLYVSSQNDLRNLRLMSYDEEEEEEEEEHEENNQRNEQQ